MKNLIYPFLSGLFGGLLGAVMCSAWDYSPLLICCLLVVYFIWESLISTKKVFTHDVVRVKSVSLKSVNREESKKKVVIEDEDKRVKPVWVTQSYNKRDEDIWDLFGGRDK